ncbi:MAG: hypothetical protein WCI90_07810 [Chlorobium sp.]|nr:MAG: hypothetical protein FDX17_00760 [Chlorobium sp.]
MTNQQKHIMDAANSVRIDGLPIPAALDKVSNLLVAARIVLDGGDENKACYGDAVLDVAQCLLFSVRNYLAGGDPDDVGYVVSMNALKH